MGRPRFDVSVPANGYRWWYADALSDDGRHGLTVIAFVGSVFSPYYKWARRRGPADPENHCAINVALYGAHKRWAMTERGKRHMTRDADVFAVGPSSLRIEANRLVICIDEVGAPIPRRLKGEIVFHIEAFCDHTETLEAGGHIWRPVAPNARMEARFTSPELRWSGIGYLDSNWGATPLEDAFRCWTWSRAPLRDGSAISYDVLRSDGARHAFALRIGQGCGVERLPLPQVFELPKTLWRVDRPTLSETPPRLVSTLEDTPFYSRSLVTGRLSGEDVVSVHESLSLGRFSSPIVQLMLPFRMPRRP